MGDANPTPLCDEGSAGGIIPSAHAALACRTPQAFARLTGQIGRWLGAATQECQLSWLYVAPVFSVTDGSESCPENGGNVPRTVCWRP